MSSAAGAKATAYANSARDKLQGVMSTIKAMTFDEDGSIKKAPDTLVAPWENMVRTMFGSCTSGMPTDTGISPNSSRSSKSRTCEASEPLSPSREKEEFFYSQFLNNDHTRAEQAVSTLRDNADKKQQQPEEHHRMITESLPSPKKKILPKQFPVSTPPRKQQTVPPILVQEIAPPKTRHGEITSNMSFDDGISCISAQTLDEMARQVPDPRKLQLTASDLTSEGFETIENAPSSSIFSPTFSPERINEDNCQLGSPIDLNRTGNSKVSKARSSATKSTRSTCGSFENKWRQDEQLYWQDVVAEQDDDNNMGTPEKRREIMEQRVEALKQRSRSRDSDSPEQQQSNQLKPIQTSSTYGSSFSGSSPFCRQHPHETFPFDAQDVLHTTVLEEEEEEIITTRILHVGVHGRRDPDRLQEILVLDQDTELGEI